MKKVSDGDLVPDGAPAARRTLVYVHLFHGWDAELYRCQYLAGRKPDETPYGFHLAAREGFDISFSRDKPRGNGLLARLAWRLPEINFLHALANRDRIRAADVIWTIAEGEAFAVAALMALRIVPRRPVIGNAIWLLDSWHRFSRAQRLLYRWLSRYVDIMTVHSLKCLPPIRSAMPGMRSQLMYFGINTDTFKITPPRVETHAGPLRLFAAGNDSTRDWTTMLAAFGNDPRFKVTVICGWLSDEEIALYANVTTIRSPTMSDFARCYAEADMVVIPMVENLFSGITVALEAVALGKPVLAHDTGGLRTYFEDEELLYVSPGAPLLMREAAAASTPDSRLAQARRAQERLMARDYSTRAMIGRYAALTRELLGAQR